MMLYRINYFFSFLITQLPGNAPFALKQGDDEQYMTY